MSATIGSLMTWLSAEFWDRLYHLEARHRRVHFGYETVRRQLAETEPNASPEFPKVWARFCDVIVELEGVAGQFEALRFCDAPSKAQRQ